MPPLLAFWSSSLYFPRRGALFILEKFPIDSDSELSAELRLRRIFIHYLINDWLITEHILSDWMLKKALKKTRKYSLNKKASSYKTVTVD